jgi:hypothetical protein
MRQGVKVEAFLDKGQWRTSYRERVAYGFTRLYAMTRSMLGICG